MANIAYLCTDLLFTSKIRETAAALGMSACVARDPASLLAASRGASLVVLDLRRGDAIEALRHLRADPECGAVPAVGFCDHERTDLFEAARAAGVTRVHAKGKFSSSLGEIFAAASKPVGVTAGEQRGDPSAGTP